MDLSMRKMFSTMIEFIAWSIGPDFEVVIFDYQNGVLTPFAVANNYGGRPICAASTGFAEKLVAEQKYIHSDYVIHRYNITDDGRPFRCGCFFIKDDEGGLLGALSVNFDQQRYQEVSAEILKLCHPNRFIENAGLAISSLSDSYKVSPVLPGNPVEKTETLHETITRLTGDASLSTLSPAERQRLVLELDRQGIFAVKGTVKRVADMLRCSPSSIYRYLSQTSGTV